MGVIKEFKEFAVKGNVVDMAVGLIIGGAFGKIVSSLVTDIIMPPIGLLLGGMDFSKLAITLKPGSEGVEPVLFKYGMFINASIDFLLIAFAVFMLIKGVNAFKKKEAKSPNPPPPPEDIQLLTEIRDLLKK